MQVDCALVVFLSKECESIRRKSNTFFPQEIIEQVGVKGNQANDILVSKRCIIYVVIFIIIADNK